jgi:starvation-inducible outer membrane lipoprotein
MKRLLYLNCITLLFVFVTGCSNIPAGEEKKADSTQVASSEVTNEPQQTPFSDLKPIDTAAYDRIQKELANGDTTGKWPAKHPYPSPGAILPFNRILAFYGNLYSKKMGALGEYPKYEMLGMLKREVKSWQAADTSIPIIPALHYVSITAQGAPGKDGKYRARMPHAQIDTIVSWANEIKGLAFVDVQVGLSTLPAEIPTLEKFMMMPNVHLGIDPEFAMLSKGGKRPGTVIGSFDAADINWVIDYLAGIVKKNNIPPKILVVHRFTNGMVRNFQNLKKVPQVQIVMCMDGWGDKILKKSSYILYEKRDPVMFTGFKLFYKNDIRSGADQLYSPGEVLSFQPKPIYIQYQ